MAVRSAPVRFQGDVTIDAPREQVWGFLTDPHAVSECAPGVESLEILEPGRRFRAVAAAGFGSVRVRFVTDAEWLDVDPPTRARMKVHGTAPGSAFDAVSEMSLEELAPGRTGLAWAADVTVVGTIASVAARLMTGVTRRLTDAFFSEVKSRIEAAAPPAPRAFRFGPVPLAEAEGLILGHNVATADGRPLFRKGRALAAEDVRALAQLGRRVVYVAEPGDGDVGEDAAAARVAVAATGSGLRATEARAGRVNLIAVERGVLRLDPRRLVELNELEGITAATLRSGVPVEAAQVVATIKVIPFAVPSARVERAEGVARGGGPLFELDPLSERRVALILTGTGPTRERVERAFVDPLRRRVEGLGSRVDDVGFVALEEEGGEAELAAALERSRRAGAELIVLAGETAIVDADDIAPRAIRSAGGEVVCLGAPVDPGNLLLLAYLGGVPVLGAPGCARSRKVNVIDFVLPRLLAGERLGRAQIVALGHGGLLEDAPERPAPRSDLV